MELEAAIELAIRVHRGQVDKLGDPYILHVLAVMLAVPPWLRVAAVLHDVIEDGGILPKQLTEHGVLPEDVALILALTHRKYEPYPEYLERVVAAGPNAVQIKLADAEHNVSRLEAIREVEVRDRLRRKYGPAILRLRLAMKQFASKKGGANA